jgi:hypothetical protein
MDITYLFPLRRNYVIVKQSKQNNRLTYVSIMANYNVSWIKSTKGNDQLVVDDFTFTCNGKGKQAGVKYWICSEPGCKVKAKTNGNQLISLNGADKDLTVF